VLNSRPYLVSGCRQQGARAGKLTFELNGTDLTQGTASATQRLIHDKFSTELPDTLFHSQQSVLKLLEASDADFKNALASLVDLTTWQACESAAKDDEKSALATMHDAGGSLRALEAAHKKAKAALAAAQVQYYKSICAGLHASLAACLL
jgi:hypothetical protein